MALTSLKGVRTLYQFGAATIVPWILAALVGFVIVLGVITLSDNSRLDGHSRRWV